MARQATLFDETMRQTAEQATWRADGLQDALSEAWKTIERLEAENAQLRQKVQALTAQLNTLRQRGVKELARIFRMPLYPWQDGQAEPQDLVKALTKLAAEVHPDRHGGSAIAEECTKAVLHLRDSLRQ